MKHSKRIFRALFFCVFTVLLAANFGWNLFGVAPAEQFKTYQRPTEAHVIGRMVIARSHGLFSYGGLTGVGCALAPEAVLYRAWPAGRRAEAQFTAYLNDTEFPDFDPYMSQPGWQALLFSIADRALPFSSATKLATFRCVTALLTAGVLSVVLLWFLVEMGWLAALLAGVSLVASQWLCMFGRNLWWSTWSFYLPMLAVMLLLRHRRVASCKHWVLGVTILLALFIKCMMTGYEYITTTCVMLAIPLAYYQIRAWPGIRRVVLQWAATAAGILLAGVLSMTIMCAQIGAVSGGFSDGIEHIRLSFFKRTYGDPKIPNNLNRHTARVSARQVVKNYNGGVFYGSGLPQKVAKRSAPGDALVIRYTDLLRLFGIVSLLGIVLLCLPRRWVDKAGLRSAILATWLSLLAPYSWFVLFKGHSIIHPHMNFILWQMPFTLFGSALIGLVLTQASVLLFRAGSGGAQRALPRLRRMVTRRSCTCPQGRTRRQRAEQGTPT